MIIKRAKAPSPIGPGLFFVCCGRGIKFQMGCLDHLIKLVSGLVWCGLLRFEFNEPRGFGYSAPDTLCWHKEHPEKSLAWTVLGVPDAENLKTHP